jgi:hypothetical protein
MNMIILFYSVFLINPDGYRANWIIGFVGLSIGNHIKMNSDSFLTDQARDDQNLKYLFCFEEHKRNYTCCIFYVPASFPVEYMYQIVYSY